MEKKLRLIMIEDNQNYIKSLTTSFKIFADIECVDIFNSVEAFMNKDECDDYELDCILLDLNLPGVYGLDAIPEIKDRLPEAEIIVLTSAKEHHKVLRAISLGASGYILKSHPIKQLHQMIHEICDGASVIDPELSRIILSDLVNQTNIADENPLSRREIQLLTYTAEGLTKKEVADRLNLSYHTIDSYTRSIYKKLQATSMAAAIAKAIRKNYI